MTTAGIILAIAVLFYFLGKSADIIVINVRKIAGHFGVPVFFLGLILGFLTSLPEFSIGINSLVRNATEISFGNLIGGLFVLFGLILGISAFVNRGIKTDGKFSSAIPFALCAISPVLLGFDGRISQLDGIALIILYFFVIYHAKTTAENSIDSPKAAVSKKGMVKIFFAVMAGIILLIIFSTAIMNFTLLLFNGLNVSKMLIGVVVFSLGTNLPEVAVTVRAWKKHAQELSMSNIIGSALANIFIIGVLAFMRPFRIETNASYIAIAAFLAAILALFVYFYETNRKFSRKEGFVLFSFYAFFIIAQISLFA